MNKKILCLLALILNGASGWAQQPAPPDTREWPATTTEGETLYEVDRDVLMQALQRLAKEVAPAPAAAPQRLSTEQLLQYQMLIQMLTQKTAATSTPVAVAPAQVISVAKEAPQHTPNDHKEIVAQLTALRQQTEQNAQQLALLQRQIASVGRGRSSSRSALNDAAPLLDIAGNAALLASLQKSATDTDKRLAKIEEQQKTLLALLQNQTPVELLTHTVEAPLEGQSVESEVPTATPVVVPVSATPAPAASAKVQQVPADFKRSVFFPVGKSKLSPKGMSVLDEAVRFMSRFPAVQLDLQGFASPEGRKAQNEKLAQARLRAVQDYLQQKGIAPARLRSTPTSLIDSESLPSVARRVDLSLVQP